MAPRSPYFVTVAREILRAFLLPEFDLWRACALLALAFTLSVIVIRNQAQNALAEIPSLGRATSQPQETPPCVVVPVLR